MRSIKVISIYRSITLLKIKETLQGKQRGCTELLYVGKSRTYSIIGGIGKGSEGEGAKKA